MVNKDAHTPPEEPLAPDTGDTGDTGEDTQLPEGVLAVPDALSTPESWLDPFDWYAEMRETEPVHWDAERECWDVFRYDDVRAILTDHETFSSDPRKASNPALREASEDVELDTMLGNDPPKHDQLRGVVEEFFRPRAVADLAPRIEEIANDCLDDVVDSGEMDLVDDLAYPLPVIVIAELLGVPSEDRDTFKRWSDTLVETPTEQTEEAAKEVAERREETLDELRDYFDDLIEQRRAHPEDDLISDIVQAEVDHRPLTRGELLGFCTLLLVAGNITTTNLLTNAVWTLTENPGALRELDGSTGALTRVVEETLRYRSPVQALARVATHDVALAGQTIQKGDVIIPWIGSANRDPKAFPQVDQFVADRTPNQHFGFGRGVHYCLGAPLARLETRIALSVLLSRVGDIEAATDSADLEPVPSAFIYGVQSFPIRFVAREAGVERRPVA
ncbi:cytochrome P450 [Haloarchaeobius sp. DFWS5]|uniref:cytochrome P450 n=1 Tax=Haloarchaeobius sp. DFWS5 TaxID=3446114 RepID=UPI003EBD30BF